MSAVRDEVSRLSSLYADQQALRLPPHSIDAEQSVLGGLMLVNRALIEVQDVLVESDFYRRDHQLLWRCILQLAEKRQPFDAVTIGEWFEATGQLELVGDGAYIIELANNTPSAANVRAYAEIVAEKARLRGLIDAGHDLIDAAYRPQRAGPGRAGTEPNRRPAGQRALRPGAGGTGDGAGVRPDQPCVLDAERHQWLAGGYVGPRRDPGRAAAGPALRAGRTPQDGQDHVGAEHSRVRGHAPGALSGVLQFRDEAGRAGQADAVQPSWHQRLQAAQRQPGRDRLAERHRCASAGRASPRCSTSAPRFAA